MMTNEGFLHKSDLLSVYVNVRVLVERAALRYAPSWKKETLFTLKATEVTD